MQETIYIAIYMMGGLGLIVGVCLAAASKIFYVYVDPKILAVEDLLPGANCGGCGLPGCSSNAEAIVTGKSAPTSCVAAGPETAQAIAALLGVAMTATEPDIARAGCYYSTQEAETKYEYDGLGDCRAAALLSGGMKVCTVGCLGLGTCARACPFGAISMGPDGLPVVDEGRCTGCGTCERVCPKHIITLSSVTRRIIREYTTDECTTPCQRACPAGINIREYIHQICEGNYTRAVQVIKERNPFPSVIGRICPRPCEEQCRRQYVDEPVAINYLKRFVADYERETGERVLPFKAPETGRRIAVAGGGVSGLSTAFFSARLGHGATVFEADEKLGGLLRSAIAANRLPAEVLDWDIQGILDMGVTTETGKIIGRDVTVSSLLSDGFDAVYLATGGWDSRLARKNRAGGSATLQGMALMIDLMRMNAGEFVNIKGRQVVIVATSALALKAANTCSSLGAAKVTVLFRESRASAAVGDIEPPDGIEICFETGIHRILGIDSPAYAGITGADLMNFEDREIHRIPAEYLIFEAGRFPELIFVKKPEETADAQQDAKDTEPVSPGGAPLEWEAVMPYKKPEQREEKGLFSPGDAFTDFSAAIKAIGAGRRAAASIHQLMNGILPMLDDAVVTGEIDVQNVDHVKCVRQSIRHMMPVATPAELSVGKELEKGYTADAARAEAERCLQCGLVCYKQTECEEMSPPVLAAAG
jgi:formate dehydrogenase beta subunit